MLALGTVRDAVLSNQPWQRLDELVRAELASGRTTRQIYKSLMGMADEIGATPDLTEDGSDAFGDALDALTGYCRRDCQYKDPPNPALPDEEEIAELPRWAQVAFGARCARRVFVFPQLVRFRDRLKILEAVGRAITVAEQAASIAKHSKPRTIEDARLFSHSYWEDDPQEKACAHAMSAALSAESGAKDTDGVIRASSAAQHAASAGSLVADLTPIIRRDFDHLSRLAEWQKWTNDTPVPPEVFGPLWPEGPPKGWPPITDAPQRTDLVVEMFARERVTEQVVEDDVVNLFNALNRYHIARSGVRLTLEQFQSLLPAFVPVEV